MKEPIDSGPSHRATAMLAMIPLRMSSPWTPTAQRAERMLPRDTWRLRRSLPSGVADRAGDVDARGAAHDDAEEFV